MLFGTRKHIGQHLVGLLCWAGKTGVYRISPMDELQTCGDRVEAREKLWTGDFSPGLSGHLLSDVQLVA